METGRWSKIEEIFSGACALQGTAREDFVSSGCAGDRSLYTEVTALLREHETPSAGLDTSVFDVGLQVLDEDSADKRAGSILGKYRFGRMIGRGGMGEIYDAEDRVLGRRVAIKLVNELFALDPERIRRFRKEADAASRVSHPNVARLFELCEIDGEHLIVMEFVDGVNLRSLMKAQMPPGRAVNIAVQVVSALVAAHSVGVVHRDIKPENIIIQSDGTVKVLDFGLAKLVDPIGAGAIHIPGAAGGKLTVDMSTELGAIMGTPAYMSPEQIRGDDVDTQTDIWSVGVLLYEMIAGELPFRSRTKIDSIAAVLISEPAPLTIDGLPAPAAIGTIIQRSLRKEKENRYHEARELLNDLRSLENGASRTNASGKATQWFRNNNAWKYAVAGVFLIAMAAGLVPESRRFIISRLSGAAADVPGQQQLTDGLVSYWSADGNANDPVGGNNGELLNGATYRPGVSGQAFSFDGVDDLMEAPTDGIPSGSSDRTMTMWVYVDGFVTIESFFGGYGAFGSFDQAYFTGTSQKFLFITNWGKGPGWLEPMESGRWYHVGATTDQNTTSLYLNGILVRTEKITLDTPTGTTYYSGRISGEDGDTRRLRGAVDEIKIWARALSPEEINEIFSAHTPPSGLVSYWTAEGNADDVIGDNDGSLVNEVAFAPGYVHQAFSLDGNGYIEVPDSPSLSITGPLTLAANIKLTTNTSQQAIIEKYEQPGINGYVLRIGSTGKIEASVCDQVSCGYFLKAVGGATAVSTGVWHKVAAVYDGASIKIYLDGILDGTIPTDVVPADGASSLKIGARGDDTDKRFGGLIDEVKIYNRALSATEISLISYWPADGNANDVIGNNNGKLTNGASYRPGVSGQAFSYDGIDDLMQAPTNGLPTENSDRTLSMWVTIDDFLTPSSFLGGYGEAGKYGNVYYLTTVGGNYLGITNWGEGQAYIPIERGRWYHIAATTDRNSTSLYVDAELVKTQILILDTPADTEFYSGSLPGPFGKIHRLKGSVDEIMVFDRALSAAEIQAIFQAHTPQNSGVPSALPHA